MKYLIITISFIISVKINAMNLLDYKADSNRITLEDALEKANSDPRVKALHWSSH